MKKKYKVLKVRLDEKAIIRFDRASYALDYFISQGIPDNIGGIKVEKAYRKHLEWFDKIVYEARASITDYEIERQNNK